MTPCASLATTYAETLEYPCGLYDRSIVLPPAKATLPLTVTVSILVGRTSTSAGFGEFTNRGVTQTYEMTNLCRQDERTTRQNERGDVRVVPEVENVHQGQQQQRWLT